MEQFYFFNCESRNHFDSISKYGFFSVNSFFKFLLFRGKLDFLFRLILATLFSLLFVILLGRWSFTAFFILVINGFLFFVEESHNFNDQLLQSGEIVVLHDFEISVQIELIGGILDLPCADGIFFGVKVCEYLLAN